MKSLYILSAEVVANNYVVRFSTLDLASILELCSQKIMEDPIPNIVVKDLLKVLHIRVKSMEGKRVDDYTIKNIVHPCCEWDFVTFGESWEIPFIHEWLCRTCGKPKLSITRQ